MKSIFYMGIVLLFTILIIIPSTAAWNSGVEDTHDKIATKLYYSTPIKIRTHLDLDMMKRGARWPDYNRESKKWHGYPYSKSRTIKFLDKAKKSYYIKDYKMESFYYGEVSHYVSDTFAAPHNVRRLSFHNKYYDQADLMGINNYKIKLTSIDTILRFGHLEGIKSSKIWEQKKLWKYKKTKLVQDDLNRAFAATLSIYRKGIGF